MESSVNEVDSDHALVDGVHGVDDDDDAEHEDEEGHAATGHQFDLFQMKISSSCSLTNHIA